MTWIDLTPLNVTDHQRGHLAAATRGNLGILTGGPGTGKSHIAAELVRQYRVENPSASIIATAPTGKAAVRITEAMSAAGIDLQGCTIHRALGPSRNGHDGDGWGFIHNRFNPMPADLILMDEAGMVNCSLAAEFLSAVAPGTRVLMVGDPFQLPPVGHGKPFLDMIDSGRIPHGHLSEVHRFAGRIAHVCRAIKDGEHWEASQELDWEREENPENLKFYESPAAGVTLNYLKAVVGKMREKVDIVEDFQVVTPLNEKGPLSRKELNPFLQGLINPDGERLEKVPFAAGDKVVCRRNQWLTDTRSGDLVYVANGEMGQVKAVEARRIFVQICGGLLTVPASAWIDFQMGYAITVHSSQGSAWPVVVVLIDDSGGAKMVASRSFYYTAISRAAKLCILIGRRGVMNLHLKSQVAEKRKTFLADDLKAKLQGVA